MFEAYCEKWSKQAEGELLSEMGLELVTKCLDIAENKTEGRVVVYSDEGTAWICPKYSDESDEVTASMMFSSEGRTEKLMNVPLYLVVLNVIAKTGGNYKSIYIE